MSAAWNSNGAGDKGAGRLSDQSGDFRSEDYRGRESRDSFLLSSSIRSGAGVSWRFGICKSGRRRTEPTCKCSIYDYLKDNW